jgi:release factor glutamine methyltransferase
VFVPRVRTELLAEQALAELAAGDVVVELCCGVAAVAAVLQSNGRVSELYVADIDPVAVGYARRNVVEPGVVHRAARACRPDRRERAVRAHRRDRADAT